MAKTNVKSTARIRRKRHIRKKVFGSVERPRLSVFRSANHIYAQVIDDVNHKTLASASSIEKAFEGYGGNIDGASKVGKMIAEKAKEQGVTQIVFDRNGYLFHGRVKALADAARAAGLQF
ncbi:MAG: 50S ribosomal protein L18 [Myxococcota bacterium]|nr:50S ribosomal protein L18 [Myxococcota bacterium]